MSLLSDIQSIDDLDVENQRVLIRADLDVPMTRSGEILDDHSIAAVVPTIKKLQSRGAQVIIASQFGESRDSKKGAPSIEVAAARLGQLAECDVLLPDACTGDSVKKVLSELRSSQQIIVLENLALEGDKSQEAESFARRLKNHVDIYVADSLRVLAEESASTTHLPRITEFRAAGVSLMRELASIARIQSKIDPPRLIIWGGNSLSGRLDVLDALLTPDSTLFLTGVAANTMLRALGESTGRSAVEEGYLAGARTLADRLGDRLVLPLDFMVGSSPRATEATERDAKSVRADEMALDLGPRACNQLKLLAEHAGTVIWCGTVGFHKAPAFAGGTRSLIQTLADSDAFTLVAGEDSVAAAHAVGADLLPQIDCVSLGGTATLSLLKDNKLPGLSALTGPTHE